jgi:hypothetical protein
MVFASYFDQYWTPFYIFINLTIYLIFLGPNTAHSLTLELDPFFCYSVYKKAAVTFYSPQFWFSFSLRITYLSFLFSNHYLCCFFFICNLFFLSFNFSIFLIFNCLKKSHCFCEFIDDKFRDYVYNFMDPLVFEFSGLSLFTIYFTMLTSV